MRLKIIFIIILLVVMALLPVAVSTGFAKNNISQAVDKKSENITEEKKSESAELSKEDLCALTAGLYKEEYTEETIKAISVILSTNYKVNPEIYDLNDSDTCIYEDVAQDEIKENYEIIKQAVDKVYEKTLCKDSKAFFIPYSYLSDGSTEKNSDYPYLSSIASPWDCFSTEFDETAQCSGVSLYGLNHLCESGADYTSALKWYLPDFEVV